MDPQACLQRAIDAFSDEEYDDALLACQDLARWLERGGFPPTAPRGGGRVNLRLVQCAIASAQLKCMPNSAFLPALPPSIVSQFRLGDQLSPRLPQADD